MNPFENMISGANQGTNLLSIIINVAFGFVLGLIIFIGFQETIELGTKYAQDLLRLTGYGDQMGAYGFATSAAPFIIIAPIGGMVVKELSSVRSIKSFSYFAIAVVVGLTLAFFTRGYFV